MKKLNKIIIQYASTSTEMYEISPKLFLNNIIPNIYESCE